MVTASSNKDLISPLFHNCCRLSRASKCSLFLTFCLAFLIISRHCVYCFQANRSQWFFCAHAFKSLVTSLMYFFPKFPVGNIKRFFLQETILS